MVSARFHRGTVTQFGMDASDPILEICDDDERHVLEAWGHGRRQVEHAADRAALVAALLRALARPGRALIQMASAAAAYASARAAAGLTLAELVADLDRLEFALLSVLVERSGTGTSPDRGPAIARNMAQRVHDSCSVARCAAIASYGQTTAMRARSRVRSARHDIVNAIGAVRNSMLIMDDEATAKGRERLRTIARRNSRRSEALVRACLADDSVLTGAVGWAEVEHADDRHARDEPNADPTRTTITDIAAAFAMLEVLERAGAMRRDIAIPRAQAVVRSDTPAAAIRFKPPADSPLWQPDMLAAFQEFAATLGARFEPDAEGGCFRLLLPLVVGHSRDDLGGAREGDDRDAVSF
jgi:hypothetical protein